MTVDIADTMLTGKWVVFITIIKGSEGCESSAMSHDKDHSGTGYGR